MTDERKTKYCPMSFNTSYTVKKCLENNCGWWNESDFCCSLVVLSNASINLAEMACGQRIIYTKEC